MLKDFAEHSVRHVRRTGNKVAHFLAWFGCENKCCEVWEDDPLAGTEPAMKDGGGGGRT
jgi:hypothetical protein